MRQIYAYTLRSFGGVIILTAALIGCSERGGDSEPAAQASTGAAMYGLRVEVSYAGEDEQLADPATVYAFLRKPGTRMPLAVQHFPGRDLPKQIGFTGEAQHEDIELIVRLSPSGQIDRSIEDIEVTQVVPGFQHPPQTLSVVLGSPAPASVPAAAANLTETAATYEKTAEISIPTAIDIDQPHPFPPDTVVFLIARTPGQSMPTAVRRLSLAELPTRIELTNADSMTLGNQLSDAASLDLFARVSSTGTAAQSSTDWLSDTVRLQTSQLPEVVALRLHSPID